MRQLKLIILFLFTLCVNMYSQVETKIFEIVEQPPSFAHGNVITWLSQNIQYPPIAEENNIQGRVVVSFVVEKDGSISDVKVVRGVDPALDKEAVRVVSSMPKWNPGKQDGKAVRVRYNLPITFRLGDDTENPNVGNQLMPQSAIRLEETTGNLNVGSQLTPQAKDSIIVNLVNNMVKVDGGTFTMGCTKAHDSDANENENPEHQVTLSDFYIGKYEVTQEEWEAVMGRNPSYFKGKSDSNKRPVERVSWDDCQEFIKKLNQLTGKNFRLPTEAEWEYAARGGNKSNHYKYAGGSGIGSVAWYTVNASDKGESSPDYGTHPVGQKSPNELGLYDMSGNVWEWCEDWFYSDYYKKSPSNNPCNTTSASGRVGRGGSWNNNAGSCRVSHRGSYSPNCRFVSLGFRLAF